jgi:hypothetical protein
MEKINLVLLMVEFGTGFMVDRSTPLRSQRARDPLRRGGVGSPLTHVCRAGQGRELGFSNTGIQTLECDSNDNIS